MEKDSQVREASAYTANKKKSQTARIYVDRSF